MKAPSTCRLNVTIMIWICYNGWYEYVVEKSDTVLPQKSCRILTWGHGHHDSLIYMYFNVKATATYGFILTIYSMSTYSPMEIMILSLRRKTLAKKKSLRIKTKECLFACFSCLANNFNFIYLFLD